MTPHLSTNLLFKQMIQQSPQAHLLSEDELQAVQKLLLLMMDDIHQVCTQNGLSYVICGGAALGAVRHGGFIPWDDDIDICMPRQDYDRLRDCMAKAFPDKYYVQEIRTCHAYDLNFTKIRLNGTVFCEFLDTEPEKAGVFIDVFPVENVSDRLLFRRMHQLLVDGLQFICSCVRIRRKKHLLLELAWDNPDCRRPIRLKALLALPFMLIPFRRWLLWTERACALNHNNSSTYVTIPTGTRHFKGETYLRNWLFPGHEGTFANHSCRIMSHPEAYLTQMYGDYMTPPPVEKRERHALNQFDLKGFGQKHSSV